MSVSDEVLNRLTMLRNEYEQGAARLRTITQQEIALRETLLRISGAVAVLEEIVEAGRDAAQDGTDETRGPVTELRVS